MSRNQSKKTNDQLILQHTVNNTINIPVKDISWTEKLYGYVVSAYHSLVLCLHMKTQFFMTDSQFLRNTSKN